MDEDGEDIATGASVLIGALDTQSREALMAQARRVSYAPGATIFSYGDPGETMLIIEAGRVEISLMSKSGRKSVMNVMGPGEALGEVAMLDRRPRSADAIAMTEVTGLVLHRSDVLSLLQSRPEAAAALMAELCAKVRNASELFAAQAVPDAPARLARCLLRLAAKWGEAAPCGGLEVREAFSQRDLGEFSGLARENVNRVLRRWSADGLVTFARDGFTIAHPDRLREIAGV